MIGTKVFESKLLTPKSVLAITLFGLVFTRDKRQIDKYILNHELVHCQQQLEWLYIPFFILYGLEYMWHLLRLRNHYQAYRAISFEREAYDHDHDLNYLKRRKHFANYRR